MSDKWVMLRSNEQASALVHDGDDISWLATNTTTIIEVVSEGASTEEMHC